MTYNQLGDLYAACRPGPGPGCLDQAAAFCNRLVADHADVPSFKASWPGPPARRRGADRTGQRADALEALDTAATIGRRLVTDYPDSALRASTCPRAAMPGRPAHGSRRMAASPESLRRSRDSCSHSLRAGRSTRPAKQAGRLQVASPMPDRSGHLDEALRLWREVRDIRERLAYENPAVIDSNGTGCRLFVSRQAVQPVQEFPRRWLAAAGLSLGGETAAH